MSMKAPRTPPDWWPSESEDVLFTCALRFDGGKLDQDLAGAQPLPTYAALLRVYETHHARSYQLLADDTLNFGILFLLQRTLKWSDLLADHERVLFLKLFLRLHDTDVPDGYELTEYHRRYQCQRPAARALALKLSPLVRRLEQEIPFPTPDEG